METEHAANNGMVRKDGGGKVGNGGLSEVVLRVLALVLTLVAAILLGVDKQTKIVSVTISPGLPPFNVPATAKFNYLSAFVYFVVANSIASVIAAISLVVALACKGGSVFTTILVDLMMVALLFSSIGATGAAGLLGYKGNSHLMWNKVCNVYGKFCHQVMAAVALSLLGGIAYVLLVLLGASKLKRVS